MANHTRINELRLLTKTSKPYYEQGYAHKSMLYSQAASNAHVLQMMGGLRPPDPGVSITRSVRRFGA